jgi:hypothetical protein
MSASIKPTDPIIKIEETPAANPANAKSTRVSLAGFQPMSAGTKKLDVPEREGYHRRWFRGDAGRIAKARRAGYEFVAPEDVALNNFDLGGDANASGNTDLGTRVSVISGDGADETGQPARMYLMECPIEYYEASRQIIEERNLDIADALKGGRAGQEGGDASMDQSNRYMRGKAPDLFTPKNRR